MPADAAYRSEKLSPRNLVVAVDTGGTKTAAWLAEATSSDSHRVLGQARTSAGNPLSVGFENATQAIHEAINLARNEAQLTDGPVPRAVLSIAGAANREMAQRFVAWGLAVGLAEQIAIVSDVLPILAAGTPDACGVALISGTGSSAYGRNADGRAKRCGGWGYLLGDEGSGYAIGRAALRHALRSVEEGTAHEGLAHLVMSTLNVKTVTELTRTIYSKTDTRHAVAALSRVVSAAANNGDAHALQILDEAAADLAKLVARTAQAVELSTSNCPLAISGGLLTNSERLQEQLRIELDHLNVNCVLNVVNEPLVGCVRLADARFAGTLVEWHSS